MPPEATKTFGTALELLKKGKSVSREGWNGKGQFLTLQLVDEHSKMRRPYIYITLVDGGRVPWVASQGDLLGEDWYVVSEN